MQACSAAAALVRRQSQRRPLGHSSRHRVVRSASVRSSRPTLDGAPHLVPSRLQGTARCLARRSSSPLQSCRPCARCRRDCSLHCCVTPHTYHQQSRPPPNTCQPCARARQRIATPPLPPRRANSHWLGAPARDAVCQRAAFAGCEAGATVSSGITVRYMFTVCAEAGTLVCVEEGGPAVEMQE